DHAHGCEPSSCVSAELPRPYVMGKIVLSIAGAIMLLLLSCTDATGPGNQSNDRISIVNDAGTLAARVAYLDDSIPVDSTGVGYPHPSAPAGLAALGWSGAASQASFSLHLKAEVAPPTVSGQVLQATSVSIVGNLALV